MIDLQVTLFDKSGKYKPVSTIIPIESVSYYNLNKKEVKEKAIIKICQKRLWTGKDLIKYNYTTVKVRVYDKEKIEKENRERYEKIKEEKGWKK